MSVCVCVQISDHQRLTQLTVKLTTSNSNNSLYMKVTDSQDQRYRSLGTLQSINNGRERHQEAANKTRGHNVGYESLLSNEVVYCNVVKARS